MINLKETYENIFRTLDILPDFYVSDDIIYNLKKNIELLGGYFGVRTLSQDVANFKKDEMVLLEQDESGIWMTSLDREKVLDLLDFDNNPPGTIDDWTYPLPYQDLPIDLEVNINDSPTVVLKTPIDEINIKYPFDF